MAAAAFQGLEGRKSEINDLNVYPVPDGDTGTNLSLTVKSILDDLLSAVDDPPPRELAARVTTSALMGARGNSGVILSQMVRGAMEVFALGGAVDDIVLTTALREATASAYRAIRRPVEGTMLTVLRQMSEAAEVAAAWQDHRAFSEHVLHSGWDSVRETPSLLKVLADAGVVDAGGYGLLIIFEALFAAAQGDGAAPLHSIEPAGLMTPSPVRREEPESRYTYCTSFLVQGDRLHAPSFEERLAGLGDSLLVVGNEQQLKVHIHTDEPGAVLALATPSGSLHAVEIDNMKEQTAARQERLREQEVEAGATQVVAVVSGEGNSLLFRNQGADLIVEGGQSMNPSAEDLLRAVRQARAPSVIILPNNGNIILTAEQIADLEPGREVYVVPTRSMQAGLSVLVEYDRAAPGDTNASRMGEAVSTVSSGEVTWAVRDSCVDGFQIRRGEFIGLADETVVAAGPDFRSVVERVVDRILGEDKEVLTILVGDTGLAEEVRSLAEELSEHYQAVEVEVHEGGQPLYPVLLAAE
jgi:DAK2 domain fusion protein YloV